MTLSRARAPSVGGDGAEAAGEPVRGALGLRCRRWGWVVLARQHGEVGAVHHCGYSECDPAAGQAEEDPEEWADRVSGVAGQVLVGEPADAVRGRKQVGQQRFGDREKELVDNAINALQANTTTTSRAR